MGCRLRSVLTRDGATPNPKPEEVATTVRAIARCGAGTNNIPIDAMTTLITAVRADQCWIRHYRIDHSSVVTGARTVIVEFVGDTKHVQRSI